MFKSLVSRCVLLIFTCVIVSRNVVGTEKRNEFSNTEHVLVFAMVQQNIGTVHERLFLVSNPLSSEYGRFWTQEDIKELTANTVGNKILKKYFRRNGVKIVHETLHGEYLVAMASTTIWESLLNVKFYEYDHYSNCRQPTLFNNYTLDASISSYVSAVFRVYRVPQYKFVFRQVSNSSLKTETYEGPERSYIVSLWRHHECGIHGSDKNRPK